MLCFLGTSHAAKTLKEGARRRGLRLTDDQNKATVVFVSEDTPTDEHGNRNLDPIWKLVNSTNPSAILVLTSQVPPGFTRKIGGASVYHQAETLRIEDALQRAMHPEMFIVGCESHGYTIHAEYMEYLEAFDCPIIKLTYEEAEFCKIAINLNLVSQVETTNMLSDFAWKLGLDWGKVAQALRNDSRIGKYAYLTPGKWQNSKHLLRDFVTLYEMDEPPKDEFPFNVKRSKLLEAWK